MPRRNQDQRPTNAPMSRSEYEARRAEAARRAMLRRREKERARQIRRRRFTIGLFIVSVILILALGIGVFVWWKTFSSTPDAGHEKKVIYRFGGESDTETVLYNDAFSSGELSINFTHVAKYLGMSVVGNSEKVKYVIRGDKSADTSAGEGGEEYVSFEVGSETACINGRSVRMTAKAFARGDNLWVPASFVSDHMLGVKLTYTSDSGIVLFARVLAPESTDDNIVYEKIAFSEKRTDAPPVIPDSGTTDVSVTVPTFSADLSAYEQYMNPADNTDYLVLANKKTLLDSQYQPNDLTNITDTRKDGRDAQQIRLYAAKALEALFIEMRAEGMTDYNESSGQSVSVMSGYRSYSYQEYLFNMYISQEKAANPSLSDEQAKAIVLTYSAYPGTSEHQTGLCIDMHNLPSANVAYKDQASYKWLCENAWKFGFILRYPEDKVDITGYSYEPWHWRYVGRVAAHTIWQNKLCLEEYLANLGK